MKKIILLMIFASTNLFASWVESWSEAVSACHENRYEDAEAYFTETIAELQYDPRHAHVYIDRGRMYLLLEKNEEALRDFEQGLKGNLSGEDKLRAIVSKVVVLCRLGRFDEAEEARKILRTMHPSPHIEVYENKVIIRNLPENEFSREILRHYISKAFCDSIEDVIIEDDICIANRHKKCE